MPTVTIEEAQSKLPELIDRLAAGDEVVISRNALPVAKLIAPLVTKPQPQFGRGRGKLILVAEDDEHLKGF